MVKNIKNNLTNIVVVIGLIASIGAGFSKFAKMEEQVRVLKEASSNVIVNNYDTSIAVLTKEIEVLKLEILEIKESNKNPLN
jgi:uncharacterized small protein (DUF1192 family)|tara:strand:- start:27 stop:272 length:246 start_codon:yes stop_codon:yes gene_type:complete